LAHGDYIYNKRKSSIYHRSSGNVISNSILFPLDGAFRSEETLSNEELKNCEVHHGTALISSTWDSNFFHFVFDVLGKLAVCNRFGVDIKKQKFSFSPKHKFQLEFFNLLEVQPVAYNDSSISIFENSYLPSCMASQGGQPPIELISFLRENLMKRCTSAPSTSIGSKLFISRKDATNGRFIENENEVFEEIFEPAGYKKFFPSDHSVAEQIKIVSCATHLAGGHGGAFSLMIFMSPGSSVFEIHSPYYYNSCFKNLAYNCGINHDSLNSHGHYFKRTGMWNRSFIADINDLRNHINTGAI
jgi:capsular polysaccharide biosynthesis protein